MLQISNLQILALILSCLFFFIYVNSISKSKGYYFLFSILLLIVSIFGKNINQIITKINLINIFYGNLLFLIIIFLTLIVVVLISNYNKNLENSILLKKIFVSNIIKKINIFQKLDIDILILIPALNEYENLKDIIYKIPKEINGKKLFILVIDDGSIDNTKKLKKNNLLIVSHGFNLGGGYAINTGIQISKLSNAKFILFMDGDGQHAVEDIEKFVEKINEKTDIISGSRNSTIFSLNYFNIRKVGIIFFNILFSVMLRKKITDCTTGFRLVRKEIFNKIDINQNQYYVPELLVKSIKQKYKYEEIKVLDKKRIYGKSKKGTNLRYFLGFLMSFLNTYFLK